MTSEQMVAWRLSLGLTQQAAADRLGMTKRMIQMYEASAAPITTTTALACRAVALGWRDYDQEHQRGR